MNTLFSKDSLWCTHPGWNGGGISHAWFRRKFTVKGRDCKLRISVSADNRYILFLDGKIIGRGPCRSDLRHWNYETYAVPLPPGEHVLCAKVVQFRDKPQISEDRQLALAECGTGLAFLVAGGVFSKGKKQTSMDTPGSWLCKEDRSVKNRPHDSEDSLKTFLISPPEEELSFAFSERNVHKPSLDESSWVPPAKVSPAIHRESLENPYSRWWLVPRQIPHMEEKEERFSKIIRCDNLDVENAGRWIRGEAPLKITGRAKITIDAGSLNTAFPRFDFKGGKNAEVLIRYSEALFVDGEKLVRDDPRGVVFGYSDKLLLDGMENSFQPFWFRTFRFVEIEINGARTSLEIQPPSFTTCMYPFGMKAEFESGDPETRKVWDTAWRTARLCANEHYFDCPYYEQLQYVGDTRIQALISYALTGDGRLGKQAIRHFDWSRLDEGITQSRYPSTWTQVIPGFSLYWVMMVKDYYDYFGDKDFLREMFPGIRSVIEWFERRRLSNGLVGHLPYWNFTDWLPEWPGGNPSRDTTCPLTINSLQFAHACKTAADIADEIGLEPKGFRRTASDTIRAVNKLCREDGIYLDMPGRKFTSQHVNAWAIIAGAVNGKEALSLAKRLLSDPRMSKATLYFSFYLFRAWEKTGCTELFWQHLELWKKQLSLGLSTFPETPLNPRSDCHAWSSSPLYEMTCCSLGVKPGSPGFKTILLAPGKTPFPKISGKAPTPFGIASVEVQRSGDTMRISLSIPKKAPIILRWPDGKVQKTTAKKLISSRKIRC